MAKLAFLWPFCSGKLAVLAVKERRAGSNPLNSVAAQQARGARIGIWPEARSCESREMGGFSGCAAADLAQKNDRTNGPFRSGSTPQDQSSRRPSTSPVSRREYSAIHLLRRRSQ
jgi:hypothetical protein